MFDIHDIWNLVFDKNKSLLRVSVTAERTPSATFTRPANTTTYASGDVMNNSVTVPVVLTFADCGLVNGGGGLIKDVVIISDANPTLAAVFELWLFNTTITPDNDNAVFTPTDAELLTLECVITISVPYTGDATAGAGGNRVYQSDGADRQFVCVAGGTSLFGVLVLRNAYIPISGEVITVYLKIV